MAKENAKVWYFKDEQDIIQGPFPEHEMRAWFVAGYFRTELPIATAPDAAFRPLKSVYAMVEEAFGMAHLLTYIKSSAPHFDSFNFFQLRMTISQIFQMMSLMLRTLSGGFTRKPVLERVRSWTAKCVYGLIRASLQCTH
jgi:hypothetical protein